jgi:hypothetical protein
MFNTLSFVACRLLLVSVLLILLVLASPAQSATRSGHRLREAAIGHPPSAIHLQQSAIVVDSMNVAHTFGERITFDLTAHSPNEITEAALLMRSGPDSDTEVLAAEFTPGLSIAARAVHDAQARPLAPFANILYQWRLADSAGNTLITPEQILFYEDNRFDWQIAPRETIVAHWHTGDLAFGQGVADIGYEALNRASQLMNEPAPERIDVYVYARLDDLRTALAYGGREWVGGHADPELGVVMVFAAPDAAELIRLRNDLAHEIAHIMIYQIVGPGYDEMPVWLDEGLATAAELEPRSDYADALAQALAAESLIPVASLCAPFSVDPSRAILSYAESASLVRYIRDAHGPASIHELLLKYRDGATCEGGVQTVLQVSLVELQANWERDALRANPLQKFWRLMGPYALAYGLVILSLLALPLILRRKS